MAKSQRNPAPDSEIPKPARVPRLNAGKISDTRLVRNGTPGVSKAIPIQKSTDPGRPVQAAKKSSNSPGETRLRRRLSRIFHRSISDKWFLIRPSPEDGTRGKSQG